MWVRAVERLIVQGEERYQEGYSGDIPRRAVTVCQGTEEYQGSSSLQVLGPLPNRALLPIHFGPGDISRRNQLRQFLFSQV